MYIYSYVVPNPVVTLSPINKTTAGGNIWLSCTSTVMSDNNHGGTVAIIEWRRNDSVINESTVTISKTGQFKSTLPYTINSVKLSDSGDYHCISSINNTTNTPYLISSDTVEDDSKLGIISKWQ